MNTLAGLVSTALLACIGCATAQDTPSTCSIGIGRQSGSDAWDITVYDVPEVAQRQDWNILATLKAQDMGKGASITIPTSAGVPQAITVTNVDNAPVFDYALAEQSLDFKAEWEDPRFGDTKTVLHFSIPDAQYNWTTADCGATNIILTGGFEGWTCDFPCHAGAGTKEL